MKKNKNKKTVRRSEKKASAKCGGKKDEEKF